MAEKQTRWSQKIFTSIGISTGKQNIAFSFTTSAETFINRLVISSLTANVNQGQLKVHQFGRIQMFAKNKRELSYLNDSKFCPKIEP